MHLGAEHLLHQATFFGLGDDRANQCIANLQAAPILEHRYPADVPVRQQAGGADRVIALVGEKVQGVGVFRIPFEFRRYGLFGDEHGFADAPQVGVVLLPVGQADMDFIHRQTPGSLAWPAPAAGYAPRHRPAIGRDCRYVTHRPSRSA
ncbi:hypothetical protein FQZ97_1035590 [compost metagenome]